MDLAILQRIARELDELLPGGFVNKIHQPLPRDLVLRIRPRLGAENKLMMSADPRLPRMHLTELKIPNPPSPPRFCAFLRAHFQGSRIVQVRADDDDRVVRIVATRGPEDQRIRRELILELLGRDANIILVDAASNMIMDCLHHIPAKETGTRAVMPGVEYVSPPTPPLRIKAVPAESSPVGGDPGISTGLNGKSRLVVHATEPNDQAFPTMNLAADAFFRPKLQSTMLEAYRRDATAPVKARLRSLERRLEKIQVDAERLRRLADRQTEGELLKTSLRRARKGMDRLEVQDWETGDTRIISLDPSLSPVANMERIFQKCAKGKRGEQKVQERRDQTLEEIRALQDMLYFMDQAADIEELDRLISDRVTVRRQTANGSGSRRGRSGERQSKTSAAKPTARPKHLARIEESHLFHTLPLSPGREVLVGKSAAGNEFLLRRKARPGDLWLHIKDYSGAHVLLPASGKEPPSSREIEYAAALAVGHSKARGKGKVEVMVARVEDVETLRGGIKGQVTVKRHTTILSDGELRANLPT